MVQMPTPKAKNKCKNIMGDERQRENSIEQGGLITVIFILNRKGKCIVSVVSKNVLHGN